MKKSGASQGQSASELISKRIAELGDWRGETLGRMRKLIKEADPDVVEERKWIAPASGNTAMLEGATCGTQRQARCRRRAPRRRGEGFRGEAPWLQFTNLIDAALDLPMQEKNASPEKDGTECTNKPERWVRVDGRRDQPADQGDLRRDHDPEPEPEIDELLPEPIEFGHGSLLAPSNVEVCRAASPATNEARRLPPRPATPPC